MGNTWKHKHKENSYGKITADKVKFKVKALRR